MKTRTNKVVKTLCTTALVLGFSASAMANSITQDDSARQPAVQAQQVYKYTYKVENFAGSIAQDIQLAQQDIMSDMLVSRDADIAAALARTGAELQGYALFASVGGSNPSAATWDVEAVITLLPSFKARAYL
ncbi:hypothetical protein CWE21_03230 [Pseudidiomarina aquimaris]|uniref:Uncharacterized protein n=1 Tax=Pseudidiomarina aquimaris TaxID=641841 RepID=A0A432XN66_9GAMM|nr:hypothetical protein [Pseudidiomarina aquimaris]RUO50150.1 hypothetical protein CWE21_03230 [Pseudidiomarina aquimaris]